MLSECKLCAKSKWVLYGTVVRPTILYGIECWASKKQHASETNVVDLRMLVSICRIEFQIKPLRTGRDSNDRR